MNKVEKVVSFVDGFVALVEGDNAKANAEKTKRQADSALKSHIHSYEGDTIDLETTVEQAKIDLEHASVNFGNLIVNKNERSAYVAGLVDAENNVKKAEKKLADHKKLIAFLKERVKLLK